MKKEKEKKEEKKEDEQKQDTGKYRTNTKDQFYTSQDVAEKCIQILIYHLHNSENYSPVLPLSSYLWVEPSAGNGAFLNSIPETYDKIGIDIEPRPGCGANILKQDFLTWVPAVQKTKTNQKPVIIFGNPPFGRQSSLAKAFIAHSCKFASVSTIAFILPRSFVKPSMSCAFESHFHCIHSSDVERNAFILNGGEKYDVPCVFQIWQKRSVPRIMPEKITEKGFQYVKETDPHDIVIRRVGVYAGRCFDGNNNATEYNKQTHYFIKLDEQFVTAQHVTKIVDKVNAHVFPTNTTGPRSLSKPEINDVLNAILHDVMLCQGNYAHAENL
jgi:hypothetical protein